MGGRKEMKALRRIGFFLLPAVLLLSGCISGEGAGKGAGAGTAAGYRQISQEEAKRMMEEESGYILLDVRRPDEFAAGHIPGAVCIPNESIGTEMPEGLPDLDQVILVYCRSGNRSKQAAGKLARIGYTSVYEFGGILSWTGETVREDTAEEEQMPAELSGNFGTDEEGEMHPVPELVIETEKRTFYADLEENTSAAALTECLSRSRVTLELHDYGNFEKVGTLPFSLPRNDMRITTVPGDVVLYQGNQITVYYDTNTWDLTKLAHIDGVTRGDLIEAFGEGSATATFRIEWSE